MTVLRLSLIIPPAMGISLAALNFSPFKARLSAPEASRALSERIPLNTVKESPIIQRQLLLKKEVIPERFVLLHNVLTAKIQQMDFTQGKIKEADII